MMRTMVARQVRDELHAAEASMEKALADARSTVERMISAKSELGLNGTFGDAALARMTESVAALESARDLMIESHQETYRLYGMLNFKGPRMDRTYH